MKWEHVNRHKTKKKNLVILAHLGLAIAPPDPPKKIRKLFWPEKEDVWGLI